MDIAFYAPLKSPSHPVPSGDRLMARQLVEALQRGGHGVTVVSQLRAYLPDSSSDPQVREAMAAGEITRLSKLFDEQGPPDRWITYHPYYKAPDLLGPELCRRHGIAYLTVETSYSRRRNLGLWADAQENVLAGARQATTNICLTERDRQGLLDIDPDLPVARLLPFIDPAPYLQRDPAPLPGRLITVAMMRPGDKLSSYATLASALFLIRDLDWRLGVIGDGPARAKIESLFSPQLADRIDWLGQQDRPGVADALSHAALYLWPGHGEAYGLAYLEAQAAGVPVIAQAVAGVPEVIADGRSGVLTPEGDIPAYAAAIARLLSDERERARLAVNARTFVTAERSLDAAAQRLDAIIMNAGSPR